MLSVTQRIEQIKQPYGGYVKPKSLTVTPLSNNPEALDHKAENVVPGLVGTAVDYLTRLALGTEPSKAFRISVVGAFRLSLFEMALGKAATELGDDVDDLTRTVWAFKAYLELLPQMSELVSSNPDGWEVFPQDAPINQALVAVSTLSVGKVDAEAIRIACKLVSYDVALRNSPAVYRDIDEPNSTTIEHILTMVERSIAFFDEYGPVTMDGFTMEGGYTETVSQGDGDFLTSDTVWDFKVSVKGPTSAHTLQLLMYYLMGKRSIHPEFQTVTHLGVFNPRLGLIYRIPVADIQESTIVEVSRDVIGYSDV